MEGERSWPKEKLEMRCNAVKFTALENEDICLPLSQGRPAGGCLFSHSHLCRHPSLPDLLVPQGQSEGVMVRQAVLPFSVLSLDAPPTTTAAPTVLDVSDLPE